MAATLATQADASLEAQSFLHAAEPSVEASVLLPCSRRDSVMAATLATQVDAPLEAQPFLHAAGPSAEKPAVDGHPFRKGGVLPTAILLAKAAVGAGVLSMSVHAAEVGVLYIVTCLTVGGGLTVASVCMIAEASVATGRWSFEDICEELFHPMMSFFTGAVQTFNCLGCASGYLIVCGEVFVVATGADEAWRQVFVVAIGVLVCAPLSLAPHVAFMRYFAAASVGSIFFLVFVVASYAASHGVADRLTFETFWFGKGEANIFAYMNSINVIVFAYNNQSNVPQLTGEMTPQPNARAMTAVASISTSLAWLLYIAVSVVGVLAFGVHGQQDTLVLDLFPSRHQPWVLAANLAMMCSVLICFQFQIYPIRQFCAYSVRKVRRRPANADQLSDQQLCGLSLTRWFDMTCGVVSVLLAIVVAAMVSELTVILEFVGAFAGSWISFVVPPLFFVQIRRGCESFSWWNVEVVAAMALFSVGAFFFVFGTYAAIVG